MNISVGCAHIDAAAQARRRHITAACIHCDSCGLGHRNGEVEAAAVVAVGLDQHGVAAYVDMRGFGVEDLLRFAV